MPDEIRNLTLPMDEKTARSLTVGDMVTVTGTLFTGRSLFHIRAIEADTAPPIDYRAINCFFHVGPVMRRVNDQWEVVSVEPTSSIRLERYGAAVIRKFGLRTLIGKTTMGAGTAEALQEIGGVHLSKIGICGNQIKHQIEQVREVYFLDELGKTEATWILTVKEFGPFFVSIDAKGNNYFENIAEKSASRITSALKRLGVPDDFQYTNLGPRKR